MNGTDEELHHPLRQDLMNKLNEALGSPTIDSAAKAFLWFSAIEELRGFLEDAQTRRRRKTLLKALSSKDHARAIKTCRFPRRKPSRTHVFLFP